MKIQPMGTDLFHGTETQTDMTKLVVAFHNFAKAPMNGTIPSLHLTFEADSHYNKVSNSDTRNLKIFPSPTEFLLTNAQFNKKNSSFC